jgi:hypothetical protein
MMAWRRDNAINEEGTMSHNKVQDAARNRMARTGESYAVARRAVIRQHQEAQGGEYNSEVARSKAFEVVAAQSAKHEQEVRGQLTSASGIQEIQRRFAALRAFRDLGHSVDDQPSEITYRGRPQWRCRRCGSDLQLNGFGRWMSSGGNLSTTPPGRQSLAMEVAIIRPSSRPSSSPSNWFEGRFAPPLDGLSSGSGSSGKCHG